MNNKKNFFTALLLQIVTMISGLILPRLIISTFGSEVNGLCSSITQFLSFISLLEGGLGAVVLAELYKPLEENDCEKVKEILNSCQNFFNKLAWIFLGYTLVLSIIYSKYITNSYGFLFTFSLIWILSLTTLVQYLFAITNKLLLQACQKVYVVNIVMTITVLLNLVISVVIICIYPEIHIIKLLSATIYLLQPIIYSHFVEKKYSLNGFKSQKQNILKNRWSGFTQNLAYFVNTNTDIVVLSIFVSLIDVSIYSVYMLAIAALRAVIITVANSYQGALGKYYAMGNDDILKKNFYKFEKSFWIIGIILFSTCLLLINAFVSIYTLGIQDANYFRPNFAVVIVFANMVYCVREPYRLLVLAVGRFKETNFGSIAEAVINIFISITLVWKFSLVGVAVGTLIAITYRLIYFIAFLKKDILFSSYIRYAKYFITFILLAVINICVYYLYPIKIGSFILFIIYGCIVFLIESLATVLVFKSVEHIQNTVFSRYYTRG